MRPPATKGNKKRDKLGDKMTRPREGGHTIQHQGGHLKKALRNPNSTLFEKMQNQTTHRPQRETRRKTSWETSWETRRKGERQEGRETLKGDKTAGRRTHHSTQAHMWENNGGQGETRPWEGGHTIQHRHTCGETMGDKGEQDVGRQTPWGGGRTIQHKRIL